MAAHAIAQTDLAIGIWRLRRRVEGPCRLAARSEPERRKSATALGCGMSTAAVGNDSAAAFASRPNPSVAASQRSWSRLLRLRDRLANQRLEGGRVDCFSFVNVDRAAYVSVETRVEETGRILQQRAPGEGKLHDILVGFASADDAVMGPDRIHPLPLLDDVRVCFLDELAHSAEGFPAPVAELGDSLRDQLRCRLAWTRARIFHVLTLDMGFPSLGSTLNAELLCVLCVPSLPASALPRLVTNDATDGGHMQQVIQNIEGKGTLGG